MRPWIRALRSCYRTCSVSCLSTLIYNCTSFRTKIKIKKQVAEKKRAI